MTWVRSNLIEDAAISDGSPALYPAVPGKPRYPTAHGFELNDGLSLAIYHNDVRNNSGWSIIANRSRERVMLSRSVALSVSLTRTASALQPPTSTPPARTRSAPATPTLSTPASALATTASAPTSNPPRQCRPCAATPTSATSRPGRGCTQRRGTAWAGQTAVVTGRCGRAERSLRRTAVGWAAARPRCGGLCWTSRPRRRFAWSYTTALRSLAPRRSR